MASLNTNFTIKKYQEFCSEVYGFSNDRDFGVMEMLSNIQRFVMKGLKGIRKRDDHKTIYNLLIAISWFISLSNQLHINLEDIIWQRFPYLCSYCGSKPCSCKVKKIKKRQSVTINPKLKPETFTNFQEMFSQIYPAESRNLENSGVHLAEETGELSEAIMAYRGSHTKADFNNITLEAADLFSCFMGVFNSLHVNVSKELIKMFSNNCHDCHKSPCECDFNHIMNYKS